MIKQQSGFTLIELVLVIVILGILAATALPRFQDLSGQARLATLDGVAGGMRSAASIARATQIATGAASNAALTIEGQNVQLAGGYPDAATIGNMMVDSNVVAGVYTIRANCLATYTNTGNGFTVAITSSGCN